MRATRHYLVILSVTVPALCSLAAVTLWRIAEPFGASATLADLADLQMKKPDTIILPFDLRHQQFTRGNAAGLDVQAISLL
jgi:hypothetical protein